MQQTALNQPGRLVDADATSILSSFLDATEHLPADMTRGLGLIASLDKEYQESIRIASNVDGDQIKARHALERGLFLRSNGLCESNRLYKLVDEQFKYVSNQVKSLKNWYKGSSDGNNKLVLVPDDLRPARLFIPDKNTTTTTIHDDNTVYNETKQSTGIYAPIYPSGNVPVVSDDDDEVVVMPTEEITEARPVIKKKNKKRKIKEINPPPAPAPAVVARRVLRNHPQQEEPITVQRVLRNHHPKTLASVKKKNPPPPPPKQVHEPLYCICNDVAYGKMIACDNPNNCQNGEWFHYKCVGLNSTPVGKWFCPVCSKMMNKKKKNK